MILDDLYQNLKKRIDALDARILICHVLGLSQEQFLLEKNRVLNASEIEKTESLVAERAVGKPVAKIIGKREFFGRDFITTENTLDPRPDSETLIEAVLAKKPTGKILDLGTGTGCLILTLLAELPLASGVAVDVSSAALDVAKQNARNIRIEDRVVFVQSNWFEDVIGEFDVIVSNPPYIPSQEITTLERDVREYDPMGALDGGMDGLDAYRAILAWAPRFLKAGGLIAFEIGQGQEGDLAKMLEKSGFGGVEIHPDLAGINRVLTAFRL